MPQATCNLLNRSKKALLIIQKYGKYGQNFFTSGCFMGFMGIISLLGALIIAI